MKLSYLIKHLTGSLLFFTVIFISAGRLLYIPGIIYTGIGLVMTFLNYTVLKIDDDLIKERSKPGEGTRKWDKIILGLSFFLTVTMFIIAGLDSGRYRLSPDFHRSFVLAGIIFTIAGQLIFLVVQKQNKFFSSTVRIQNDRGHTVCETGLYSVVRHPAYMGSIIQALGFPLLFGSLWSIIPVSFLVILFITRTYLEDKTLKNELKGYVEYSKNTRYMIIPYIW